jgi:penicillin amidase
MRRLRKIAVVIGLILVIVLVAGTAWGVVTVRSSFPTTQGTVAVPGLAANVEVRRDAYGVPTITADTAADLFFAQGYVHAQDRFWEMDFRRHVTAGRLSELFGESQVDTDAFIRLLGWRRTAEQELTMLDPTTIAYLEAYARGVNAYLADHHGSQLSLEYAVLGLQNAGYVVEPWTPADSVAWLKAMAWDLRGNMDVEIERTLLATVLPPARVASLYPPYPYASHPVIVDGTVTNGAFGTDATAAGDGSGPALADAAPVLARVAARVAALPTLFGHGRGIGSNAFAVAGSRTTSGKPLLVNDPHLAPSMPSLWYQVGLHCRTISPACPFDVAGYSFSGVPGIVIGHNDRVAWGFTNLGPDVTDLYLERLQGDSAIVDGAPEPLTVHDEEIKVAGGTPVTVTVRWTRHGPLLSDSGGIYAHVGTDATQEAFPGADPTAPYGISLAWTALRPGRTADALFLIDRAGSFADFRAAARRFEVPSQNLVYADVDGHIGYQAPGLIPIRGRGDGSVPAPGWDSSYDWTGFIPFDALPWVLDPPSGMVVTANQAVVGPDYPYHLTDDFDLGYRAARISELLDGAGKLDATSIRAIDFDRRDPFAATLIAHLGAITLDDAGASGARDLLAGWDQQMTPDSAAAAFYAATWRALLVRTFGDEVAALPEKDREWVLPGGGDRWFAVVGPLLDDPQNKWWDDVATPARETRDDILRAALLAANSELRGRLGGDPTAWRWGKLHTLELTNATFGKSGIGPIEWLFNRGPLELGGGQDAVDAVGWNAWKGYEVDWVPSMRMVVDLANLDASRWVSLTGASGHAFSAHYDDQSSLWARGDTTPWPFGAAAVAAAADNVLTLTPAAE